MLAMKSLPPLFAIAALALPSLPAAAAGPSLPSFGEIEFRSNPAAMVEDVRADIASHIPAGSSLATARLMLGEAGARCHAPHADGLVQCRYHGVHFTGDIVQNVSWTVDLATAGETVTSLKVARHPLYD